MNKKRVLLLASLVSVVGCYAAAGSSDEDIIYEGDIKCDDGTIDQAQFGKMAEALCKDMSAQIRAAGMDPSKGKLIHLTPKIIATLSPEDQALIKKQEDEFQRSMQARRESQKENSESQEAKIDDRGESKSEEVLNSDVSTKKMPLPKMAGVPRRQCRNCCSGVIGFLWRIMIGKPKAE